jgi:hypothetical protein
MSANLQQQYVGPDGRLTIAGAQLFDNLDRRLRVAEDKLKAIAAVTGPDAGATIDAEARAAINAIIAAA